jgi:VWFA-related protein
MPRFSVRLLAAVLAATSLALTVQPAAAEETFAGASEVVVVEVPVQVIKDGEPVRGLTAADFELFDGRKKVAITGFEALDLTAAPAGAAEASVAASSRRHFLLLFDLTFTDPNALLRGRHAARKLLDSLHPTDLVAVATYTVASGPQLVLSFSPDRAQAAIAIDTLGFTGLFNRATDPLRLVITQPLDAPPTPQVGVGTAQGRLEEEREQRDAQVGDQLEKVSLVASRTERTFDQQIVRGMTDSFTGLARVMGGIEGRKYVVFLSEGFDTTLLTGSGNTVAGQNDLTALIGAAASPDQISGTDSHSGSDETFGDTRTQNAVEKMLTEFRRADCQIQAVDLGGLRAIASEGRLSPNGRESLLNMAKSTGGDLYENFNDLSTAMGQMLRRTGVTYVLSFQPGNLPAGGEFHKLRVELKNGMRGVRLVHRPGYYPPRPAKEVPALQRLMETANVLMGEEGGSVGAAVLAAPFGVSGGRAYVPVVIEVDGKSLLAGKQDAQLPVEIYVYAIDERGAVQGFLTQSLALELAKAEAMLRQTGLKFFGHLDLPKGTYSLRTLVRNGTTGASGLSVEQVVVPGGGEPVLLPALFPEAPGRWVMVRETQAAGAAAPPYPFMAKSQPYIPASRPVLVPGQPAAVVLQGYDLGSGDFRANAEVVAADGSAKAGGSLQLAGKEGGASGPLRVTGTFEPPALQPGDYLLRVTLTDGAGAAHTSTTAFAVAAAAAGTR